MCECIDIKGEREESIRKREERVIASFGIYRL